MYVPAAFAMDDAAEITALIRTAGAGDLLTHSGDRLRATRLPIVWRPEESQIIAHMARANDHWPTLGDDEEALLVVNAPDAYISPSWYASKREHGRAVPTWNYGQVQVHGRVRVHHDPAWLRAAVEQLTDLHEHPRVEPWAVDDAPDRYVTGLLKAIVGIEMLVTGIEAVAKYSQNKSAEDRSGVVDGLRDAFGPRSRAVAEAMSDQP